jgi:hypothetical protein
LLSTRVADIRRSIESSNSAGSRIRYVAPWVDSAVIRDESVDMIYSQAVLEHVEELSTVYGAMGRWIKPRGILSHQIDYRCHGKADSWDGHWSYSDLAWRIVVGRRPYLLNRAPHSEHLRLLDEAGFDIVAQKLVRSASQVPRRSLAPRFRDLSDDDLTTSGAYVLAVAPPSSLAGS